LSLSSGSLKQMQHEQHGTECERMGWDLKALTTRAREVPAAHSLRARAEAVKVRLRWEPPVDEGATDGGSSDMAGGGGDRTMV